MRTSLVLLSAVVAIAAIIVYEVQPMLPGATAQSQAAADASRLERDVRQISTGFGPRDYAHPENLDRVAAYVSSQMKAAGARVTEQAFTVEGRNYRNVIGSYGPEDGERFVVGAHYDTAGPAPGADDNASGVAGLLELARMLAASGVGGRVDLVAFTLEEPPWFGTQAMGSARHAKSLRAQGVRVRGMISLEMIGYFSDAPGSQDYPNAAIGLFYPSVGNFIAVVGKLGGASLVRRIKTAMAAATDLPVRSINAPRFVPGVDFSDHRSYWDQGFDAVMVTDTAFLRNPNYHSMGDTADLLDYVRMGKVVTGVHAAVASIMRVR